jgi:hypothetical protein
VARIGANTTVTFENLWRGLPIVEVSEVDQASSPVRGGAREETLRKRRQKHEVRN